MIVTSHLTRRRALGLGLGVGAAALTGITTSPTAQADVYGPRVANGSFVSRWMKGASTTYEVLYPEGYGPGDRLPVLITLHGFGGNHCTPEGLHFLEACSALRAEGFPPFACAGVDGQNLWWHDRASGMNPAGMVMDEFTAVLARLGLDVSTVSLYGQSMGGVGAIWIASQMGPSRVRSLLVTSAPFSTTWDRFSNAYDSPKSFYDHDPRRAWAHLEGIPVRVDVGAQDPFCAENVAFISNAWPRPEFCVSPGAHGWDYWSSIALDQFRFTARHLD